MVEVAMRDEDGRATGAAPARAASIVAASPLGSTTTASVASDDARTRYVFVPIGPSSSWSTTSGMAPSLEARGKRQEVTSLAERTQNPGVFLCGNVIRVE